MADLIDQSESRIAREEDLLSRLRKVDAAHPDDWRDVLHIVKLVRGIGSEHAALRQRAVLSTSEHDSLPAALLAEAALSEADPNVAGAIRWALARAGSAGLDHVVSGLDSDDAEVRLRAVSAIVAHGTEATAVLEGLLSDPDELVRTRAALAVGSRARLKAMPTLIDIVVAGIRDVEAAEMLGTLSTRHDVAGEVVQSLVDRLGGDGDPRVRIRLAQALAEIPGVAAHDALLALGEDDDRTVALTAKSITSGRTTT